MPRRPVHSPLAEPARRRCGDNRSMIWKKLLTLLAAVALGAGAWRAGGWAGLGLLASALVLWLLLYYTRLMSVLQKAAQRPIGYVGSAVMLNAKLRPRVNLMHVVALTRSLGERLSAADAQPEVFRWRDGGGSQVTCTFQDGRLTHWQLDRPPETPPPEVSPQAEVAASAPPAPADARA